MSKKYFIFDFDGTVANTNNIIIASWQATLKHYLGHELPVQMIEATFGEVLADSIRKLIPGADVDEAITYYRHFQDTHHDEIIVHVFDGVREVLDELRARGCLIGVGTSRTAYSFWNYMKELDLEDAVDEVVTVNDVKSHKPDPETVNAVMLKLMAHERNETLGSKEMARLLNDSAAIPYHIKKQSVMIGDAKFDIGCAQNAGIDSVLVGWSHYVDEDDMSASGFTPTYRMQTPEELLSIL